MKNLEKHIVNDESLLEYIAGGDGSTDEDSGDSGDSGDSAGGLFGDMMGAIVDQEMRENRLQSEMFGSVIDAISDFLSGDDDKGKEEDAHGHDKEDDGKGNDDGKGKDDDGKDDFC